MKALFIGRFQPFHKGHLQIIQSASKKYDEIIIGIGSSQYADTKINPFTSKERKLMIEKSLEKLGVKNYRIELIPDIHNYPQWVPYVGSIISDFDVVITNNSLTQRLFSEKGFAVKETVAYDRSKYSGKEIRRRMMNDEAWEDLVPESVCEIIKEIGGVQRIKNSVKQ
ncbi:MAG: nicotinamide-nucleotide adenylyltransferase [Euryarchaeota archaeon]|nr:nicotinamide-nucleotide adenylyltransferase [Euryarchaeota archaeon]